jgi:transposase
VDEQVVTDELWARLEPLIPVRPRRFKHPGGLRADNRAALEGILWVLRTGVGWNRVPTTLFGVCGAMCWRRLDEWREAGVWQQLHEQLLGELRAAGILDLSAAIIDSSHVKALKGGIRSAPARSTAASRAPSTI